LFDFYFLGPYLAYKGIGSHSVIFVSGLMSVIPLAYLIGMAVSSITAQTGSLAIGAVVNATFGSVVEIILYCLALMEGKTRMVEGAIVGSFMAGLLALPGVSMFSGGLRRKEQRFNSKSATVTSTMLIMAIIGAFGPTLFQEVYGTFELHCEDCPVGGPGSKSYMTFDGSAWTTNPYSLFTLYVAPASKALQCHSCRYRQPHPTLDPIYINYTRPLMYRCATALVLVYAIGLWFTLRTHAKRIYPSEKPKKEVCVVHKRT
jgi:Ca2+:H+ antiporter